PERGARARRRACRPAAATCTPRRTASLPSGRTRPARTRRRTGGPRAAAGNAGPPFQWRRECRLGSSAARALLSWARDRYELTPMRARVTVRVPGSTSNLGAGFDCVGVAVDRWLCLTVTAGSGAPPTIEPRGTLSALDVTPSEDLLYRGFAAACARLGRAVPSG